MIDLFIVADDLTGALDTGVQFAARGVRTRVITDPCADLARASAGAEVLVLDAETRHLTPERAYDVVYDAVRRAAALGVRHIYKKTDSALRGNVGAELTAVLRATGARALPFLPAFPRLGRVTRDGVHYVDGVPVALSVFGRDPFEPVAESQVCRLIALQSDAPVRVLAPDTGADELRDAEGILVFDAQNNADLKTAGHCLREAGLLAAAAGCAGFGEVEQELLGFSRQAIQAAPKLSPGLTVVCGSVNPISRRQLDVAERAGFLRLYMTCAQKLTPGWFSTPDGARLIADWREHMADRPYRIIDANDAPGSPSTSAWAAERGINLEGVRLGISRAMGDLLGKLLQAGETGTLLITGGDTLLQCMARLGVQELEPVAELYPGVVLSRFTLDGMERMVISKSGGFGGESLMLELKRLIDRQNAGEEPLEASTGGHVC